VIVAKGRAQPQAGVNGVKTISEIVTAMRVDGTLSELSTKWYGADLTQ